MSFIKNKFIKNVFILAGSTALAQGITFAFLPLLTRLYTPNDFGILAIYVSFVGVFSAAACLRLDIAIPLAKGRQEAQSLLMLSIIFCFMTSIISTGIIYGIIIFSSTASNIAKLKPYFWLIPLGVLTAGLYSSLQFYAIKESQFKKVAKTRLWQSICGVAIQVSIGLLGFLNAFGLIFGQMVSGGAGILSLSQGVLNIKVLRIFISRRVRMAFVLIKYKNFLKYSTIESLANSASIQVPIILIFMYSSVSEAGYIMLAMKMMQVPMRLVGASIGQVFLSQAAEENRLKRLDQFVMRSINSLIKAGCGPIIFIGMLAPYFVPYIFGSSWVRAGAIVIWMTPWFVVQFLVSPIAMVLHVTENQKTALYLQISGLLIRVLAVVLPVTFSLGYMVESYAVSGFIFYLLYLSKVLSAVNINLYDLLVFLKKSFLHVGFWIACGVLLIQIIFWLSHL